MIDRIGHNSPDGGGGGGRWSLSEGVRIDKSRGMAHHSETSPELHMNPVASALFSYHVRMAAMCAIAGRAEESASESVLAWSMLSSCCEGAAAGAAVIGSELIDPEQVAASDDQRRRAQNRAHDLALSLEGHFVSVGMHEHANLYEKVADELEASVANLDH